MNAATVIIGFAVIFGLALALALLAGCAADWISDHERRRP